MDRTPPAGRQGVTGDPQARRGRAITRAGLAAAVVCVAQVIAGPVPAGADERPPVAAQRVAERPRDVRDYWTARRMRRAEPARLALAAASPAAHADAVDADKPVYAPPVEPGDSAPLRTLRPGSTSPTTAEDVSAGSDAFPRRVHGKVFLTLGGTDYLCSATVVASASHTVVWTAGHCVNGADIGEGFATNWLFVPGYREGQIPYGTWTASELLTTNRWSHEGNLRLDVGAAIVQRDSEGRGIEDVVGARGIAFNQRRSQRFDAYGFPALDVNTPFLPPDYDGEHLFRCRSDRVGDDAPSGSGPETIEIGCDMTAGASGGGWVIHDRYVNSVTSYEYDYDPGHLFGPYFGSTARRLYTEASGPRLACSGRAVTNLGGPGADDFSGDSGKDSFSLERGADRATGLAGSDAACGGGGGDGLLGGPGPDRLHGQAGADLLIGGPGRDVCDGGPGHDAARGCEVRRHIP